MATSFPIGASGNAQVQNAIAGSADVTDELGRSGMSFGKLVELTGKAVADTQLKLNQTGAQMASMLATTQVDVIAVQESVYDDEGNLDASKNYTRKLPLINFIDPVFYEWTAVRLQGQFWATELVSGAQNKTTTTAQKSRTANTGLMILLGVGSTSGSFSSTTSTTEVDASVDRSYGHVRASALLQPKRDIGVPAPRQVVRGPSLNVVAGEIQDVNDDTAIVGRTMQALIELRKQDGTPIAGKSVSIEADGAPWTFTTPGAETTDAAGQLAITLRRDFVGETPDLSPRDVVVSVRLGLVSNNTTLTF
jgi:hypothetical protein